MSTFRNAPIGNTDDGDSIGPVAIAVWFIARNVILLMGHALLVVVLARKLELSTVRVARMKMTMLVDSHHAQIVARTTMVIVSGNVDIWPCPLQRLRPR